MKLTIHSNAIPTSTVIPNIFFDTYMPRSNGEFLKVYLYLYRWQSDASKDISVASVADTLGLTEGDVLRALKYWQSQGLIFLVTDRAGVNIDEIMMMPITPENTADRPAAHRADAQTSGCTDSAHRAGAQTSGYTDSAHRAGTQTSGYTDSAHQAGAQAAAAAAPTASFYAAPDFTKPSYTMRDIQSFAANNDGDKLFFVIGQYLGRPLSQPDINTIVFFHEKLGFSIDLIEYLFEYCVSNNHRSIHYIEKVALSWAEKGVKTVSAAKKESTGYNKTYYAVLKAFGITGRAPTEGEITFIKRWHEELCFPMPLILEACRRTMLATHNPSFEYTDKILKNWKTKNVTNLDDIKALDTAYEASKKSGTKYSGNPNFPAAQKYAAQNGAESQNKDGVRRYGSRFGNFEQRVYNYNELEQKLAKKLQKH